MTITPTLTPAERHPEAKRTAWQRLSDDTWLRTRPEVSAIVSFELSALFAGLALNGAEHRDYVVAVGGYLAGLVASLFGAFEVTRAVSAGHGGVS